MTDAFLQADVCRALVEASYPRNGRFAYDRWGEIQDDDDDWPWPDDYTPAVTPLQALDWLVASGRIGEYRLGRRSCMAWLRAEDVAEHPDFGTFKGWDGGIDTPEALVRAILEAA